MWEVFTEGKMPFENKSNLQVVEAISKGFRLYRPHLAPMSIYGVMYSCWHEVGVPYYRLCTCCLLSDHDPESQPTTSLMAPPPQSQVCFVSHKGLSSGSSFPSLVCLGLVLRETGCF